MSGLLSQQYAKNKFPDYASLAPGKARKKAAAAETWQQQKAMAKVLTAVMGGQFHTKG